MIISCPKVPSPRILRKDLKIKDTTFILIYDRKLEKFAKKFPFRFPVSSGEKLKTLDSFSFITKKIFSQISSLKASPPFVIVSLGGGSVGDFSGFLASVFLRGVRLVQIPSTWLASLDSAHGGKTALNVGNMKNQIGTFHEASLVYLVKEVLDSQPEIRKIEAYGELAKMILLDKKLFKTFKKLDKSYLPHLLNQAIQSKLNIIKKDPFETKGLRRVLNLGHTMGHVLELFYKIPHGKAVGLGLWFSLRYSLKEKLISPRVFKNSIFVLNILGIEEKKIKKKIPKNTFHSLLSRDKKNTSLNEIDFIFLKDIGKPFVKKTNLNKILKEAERQGFVV